MFWLCVPKQRRRRQKGRSRVLQSSGKRSAAGGTGVAILNFAHWVFFSLPAMVIMKDRKKLEMIHELELHRISQAMM